MKGSLTRVILGLTPLALLALVACGGQSEGAEVFFEEPKDGASVTSPVKIKMGVGGLVLEPAGEVRDGHGHHNVMVDVGATFFIQDYLGNAIPNDSLHLHFGKAQTEALLDLGPGEHTLKLLFADGDHYPLNPIVSHSIKITVKE